MSPKGLRSRFFSSAGRVRSRPKQRAGVTAVEGNPPGEAIADRHEIVPLKLGPATFDCVLAAHSKDAYTDWIRRGAGLEAPLDWAQRLCEPSWEVLDLGANVGIFSLGVAGLAKRVVAVEALPTNHELLKLGAEMHDSEVLPVHAAVWHSRGTVRLEGYSAWGQIIEDEAQAGVLVNAVTVADLLESHFCQIPGLIKVDIEGAESAVLPDVFALAQERSDLTVIYETNQYASSDPVTELDDMARDAGFTLWRLDPLSGRPSLIDPNVPQTSVYCDVLALRGRTHEDLPIRFDTNSEIIDDLMREAGNPAAAHQAYVAINIDRFPLEVRNHPPLRALVDKSLGSADPAIQAALESFRRVG